MQLHVNSHTNNHQINACLLFKGCLNVCMAAGSFHFNFLSRPHGLGTFAILDDSEVHCTGIAMLLLWDGPVLM
jgi:hypothetical protein